MVPNYTKWFRHDQLPADLRVPLYDAFGIISRAVEDAPCVVGDRQATCDILVIQNEENVETHSFIFIKLPFKDQAAVLGPVDFKISEEPEDQHTAVPQNLLLPINLESLVKVLMTSNDTQLLSFDGLTDEEVAELFPVTLNFDKKD